MLNKKKKYVFKTTRKAAFTLIEAIVILAIFSIITVTFYKFFSSGTLLIIEAKKKLTAVGIANERIEKIRSLPYGDIGTITGAPPGNIDSDEYITVGDYRFHVKTEVQYEDDSEDGTEEDKTDDTPADYKDAKITVSWGSENSTQSVSVSSIISPFGVEAAVSGGTLSVNVIDIDGNPVQGAAVNVFNADTAIDQTGTSNASGNVSMLGLSPSDQKYKITVKKDSSYEIAETYPPYPTSPYYPTDVHASVVDDMVTNSVISFSLLSDIKIKFTDPYTKAVPDVDFHLEGGRILGINTDSTRVYNYSQSLLSDSLGEKDIIDINPGQYTITENKSGYVLWRTEFNNATNEITVYQGENLAVKNIKLANENYDSYLVKVIDSITGNPVDGVSINMADSTLSYNETIETDEFGYAFFPETVDSLVNGETYDITFSKTGYNTQTSSVTINNLIQEEISLVSL